MTNQTRTRATVGGAALVTGVMLIGTTGLTFAIGWALWAVGLGVVLAAVPSGGRGRRDRDRGHREAGTARFSLVR